jgi:hypothetical protein
LQSNYTACSAVRLARTHMLESTRRLEGTAAQDLRRDLVRGRAAAAQRPTATDQHATRGAKAWAQ